MCETADSWDAIYVHRRSRYNKVVTIFAMEAERLSGGMAPLIFKLVPISMWVVSLSALATLLPEKKLWFSLSWRLDWHWRWPGWFGEKIVLLLLQRFCSIYPSYCTDHAAPYWFEGNTKVHINMMRWQVGIGCVWFMTGIPGRLLWTW